ncbi:hypothetical protein N9X99_00670 [Gammaproteobacteria bacterium]|nr:hypothetical protein [Gammaproteobacteria bacterium]
MSSKIPVAISFNGIANFLGVFGVIGSLVFVGLELRQDSDINQSQLLSSDQIIELEFERLVQENPIIWFKGLEGSELDEHEKIIFNSMAYTQFRVQANFHRRRLLFEEDNNNQALFSKPYAFFIYQNSGLRNWFEGLIEKRSQVDFAFNDRNELRYYPLVISNLLSILDETKPPISNPKFGPF